MTSLAATPDMERDSSLGAGEALPMVDRQIAAVFLDVDGTLLDLASSPDTVFVPDGLVGVLSRATRRLSGALALVSGRTIDDMDLLFAPLRLRASGVHGAQIRIHPTQPIQIAPAASELPLSFRTALNVALSRFQGILIENKGFSVAIHYRLNPEIAANLRGALRDLIAAEPWRGLEIEDAHFAFELKPPSFDKGKAIAHFLACAPFRGRTPIFIGDDTTDEFRFCGRRCARWPRLFRGSPANRSSRLLRDAANRARLARGIRGRGRGRMTQGRLPPACSMAGLLDTATRLSSSWEEAWARAS